MTEIWDTAQVFITSLRDWLTLLGVFLFLLFMLNGCGNSGDPSVGTTNLSTVAPVEMSKSARASGPLKAIKWDIVRMGRRNVQIGAFVPHCEYTKPVPRVERVIQRRSEGRAILTMMVRFPPKKVGPNAGACLGVQISVARWVRLGQDPTSIKFFDGSTSPPREVRTQS